MIRKHKTQFLDGVPQERFERLLENCEKAADEIACEAAGKPAAKPREPRAWRGRVRGGLYRRLRRCLASASGDVADAALQGSRPGCVET